MKLRLLVLLVTLMFGWSFAAAQQTNEETLLQEIKKLASMLSDGPAVLSDSSIVIKNDSCLSVVDIWSGETTFALFVMGGFGGGNNSRQYLAVFRQNKKEDYHPAFTVHEWNLFGFTKVGDDYALQRFFSEISCQDNQITLTGVKYLEDDARCCPSGKAEANFEFYPYSIHELTQ